jgi:hypothetical protein
VKSIRPLLGTLAVSLLAILTACGGGGGGSNPTVPSVSISGQTSTVAPNGTMNLTATVVGDSTNAGVNWTVSGGGSLSANTTTSVTYTAPDSVPSTGITITATSVANSAGGAQVFFLVANPPSQVLNSFSGQYAFVMTGFDGAYAPLSVAGSIKADGAGHITAGAIDVNDNASNTNVSSVTGTYTLDTNGRGTITIANALPGFSSTPTFSYTIDTVTNTGAIISLDSSDAMTSGTIDKQNAAIFGELPTGSFIFRASTDNPQRGSEVGRLSIVGGGAISNGLLDMQDIYNGNDFTDQTFTGNSFTIPDTNGRGTFSISLGSGGNSNYVFYAVSATKLYIFENGNETTSSNTQWVGQLRTQSLSSLTSTSPNGSGIFGTIGGDYYVFNGVTYLLSSVAVGNLTVSGTSVTANWDLNDASQVTSSNGGSPVTGTVAFDPTTGRGTMTFSSGFSNGFLDSVAFYLQSAGNGVVMDTTDSNSDYPEALVGDLTPQNTTVTAIAGNAQSVELSSECDVAVFDTAGSITSGNLAALQDGSLTTCGGSGGTISGQAFLGTFSSLSSIGRSTVAESSDYLGGDFPAVAYAIDATHFYVIQTLGSTSSTAGFDSSLAIAWTQTLPVAPGSVVVPAAATKHGNLVHMRRENVVRKSRTETQPARTADAKHKLARN